MKTNTDITGEYQKVNNTTFIVDGEKWKIKTKTRTKRYLVNQTKDKYISGLFPLKDNEGFYSFDHNGDYYFFTEDANTVQIAFVHKKKKN